MNKVIKKSKAKKKIDVNANLKFMTFLWRLGSILEFITLPLYLAAMQNRTITYGWFIKLRDFKYIDATYYTFAAITLFVFSILVIMNRNRERWTEMLLALLCFVVQIGMLIWCIAPIYM